MVAIPRPLDRRGPEPKTRASFGPYGQVLRYGTQASWRSGLQAASQRAMKIRWRNIVGGLAILAFLAAYIWLAVAIGDHLPDQWAVRLVYFAVVGIGWGVPVIPLLSWMSKDDHSAR